MLMIIKQWHCFWCCCCCCGGRDEMVILSLRSEMRIIRAYAGGIVCFSDFLIAHIVSYYTIYFFLSFLKPTNQPTNFLRILCRILLRLWRTKKHLERIWWQLNGISKGSCNCFSPKNICAPQKNVGCHPGHQLWIVVRFWTKRHLKGIL